MEPNYQNKPATTITCRERERRKEAGRRKEVGEKKDGRGSDRQKQHKSEIYFNCKM